MILQQLNNKNVILSICRRYTTERQKELMARGLPKRKQLDGVKHAIIVASGKGGVGKSTVSVNLSVALSLQGLQVGLLDADIFGPSLPLMMNLKDEPLVDDNNLMIPPVNFGIKCNSMGLLAKQGPVIWRGPLVMSAVERLLKGTLWSPCDVLVIDTPPGTGDVHLSLAQHIPISGVLLVSTPQAAALNVMQRGAEMFKTLKIPLIGLVENMSFIKCDNCSNTIELFNNSIEKYAKEIDLEVLTKIPLTKYVSEGCDAGEPIVISKKHSDCTKAYIELSKCITKFLQL
ncbi:iron-sulfur protein NUBPL-like [Ctenocephalides felis]|uniref:iron-sulfur protein NUBPL-like n=1 Tax=Ctenocephalides felis TaxID=7515 RepID=UPI000E6E211D|nr:iron-sulfur protein NUBPL-like [Ctenocephalides felis]